MHLDAPDALAASDAPASDTPAADSTVLAPPMTRRERIAAERLAAGLAPRDRAARADGTLPGAARIDAAMSVPTSPDVVATPPASFADRFSGPAPTSPDVTVAAPVAQSAAPVAQAASAAPAAPVAPAATVAPAAPTAPDASVARTAPRFEDATGPVVAEAPVVAETPVVADAPTSRRRSTPARRSTARAAARPAARPAARVTARPVVAPRTRPEQLRGSAFRRTASKISGGAVILVVAGIVVGTSVPAQAFYTPSAGTTTQTSTTLAIAGEQSLRVGTTGEDADDVANRDGYSVTAAVKPAAAPAASGSFTNDPNGTIQWPFLTGVPISSGFGARNVAGCSFCSTFHEGVDFAPGEGVPIRVVAAGTVIKVQADDGGYGNDVWVRHDVDGKEFVSVYGHMKDGTFAVSEGQTIAVGTVLGEVGSTGNSTGPHLHLEIHVNDVPVDPLAWLRANAN